MSKFSIPQKNKVFIFPRDHGSHNDFRTEWWYVVAHLFDDNENRYGFQLTFFRHALSKNYNQKNTKQLYFAHVALLQNSTKHYIYEERLSLSKKDIYYSSKKLDLKYENLFLRSFDKQSKIYASAKIKQNTVINLELNAEKPLVIFGDDSVLQRGSWSTSHYLSYTRLQAKGLLSIDGNKRNLHGEAWMDHDFSSYFYLNKRDGWDWAGIQLFDGSEIMVGHVLIENSNSFAASNLTLISQDGKTTVLDYYWQILKTWKSPRTGIIYPSKVRIITNRRTLLIKTIALDQEHIGSKSGIVYWEGACDVIDENGKKIGRAFMEIVRNTKNLTRDLI